MPTAEQRGFWAAIRANPADDTARLVYADWLQENGDEPRAEFIRLQCRIASVAGDQKARRKVLPGLEHRQRVLRTANAARWGEPLFRALVRTGSGVSLEAWTRTLSYERGFVTDLRTDLDAAHRLATAGPDLEPVLALDVKHEWAKYNRRKLVELFAWDGVGCVRQFSFLGATDECVGSVVASTAARLTHLQFSSGQVTDAGAALLANWPCAAGLLSLGLTANRIGDAGALALAGSPHLNRLEALYLYDNPLGRAGRRALVSRFGGNAYLPEEPA